MRRQYFVTAGIFRRAQGRGFQWGVAYDYLHDIYYQNANLQQIRSETGFVLDDIYEIGYYGAYGVATRHGPRRRRQAGSRPTCSSSSCAATSRTAATAESGAEPPATATACWASISGFRWERASPWRTGSTT